MKPMRSLMIGALTADLAGYFEKLSREAETRERRDVTPAPVVPHGKVRLPCSDESIDAHSLPVALVRQSAGGELIEFLCPKCGALHESLRIA